jgi:hypothetical protein
VALEVVDRCFPSQKEAGWVLELSSSMVWWMCEVGKVEGRERCVDDGVMRRGGGSGTDKLARAFSW